MNCLDISYKANLDTLLEYNNELHIYHCSIWPMWIL